MENMITDLDIFANAKVGFLPSMLIALLGIFIYTFVQIYTSRRVKKFSEIKLGIWWAENQINFVFTIFICLTITIASWYAETLTVERALFIGAMGNFVADKFLKLKFK